MEDGVVSVDHEHFVFPIDQHHVPAGGENKSNVITGYLTALVLVIALKFLHGLLVRSSVSLEHSIIFAKGVFFVVLFELTGCQNKMQRLTNSRYLSPSLGLTLLFCVI